MAEGLLNYTRLDDPDEVICGTQGQPLSQGDEVRLVDADGRDRARRPTRRAADPRPLHAARLLPGPGAERARLHPGRLVPQRRRRPPPAGRQPGGRGPGQGHDQPGRGEDLGGGGGEPVYQLPQVAQVAAVAMPDPELGERVCVYAVLTPGAALTLDDVRAAHDESRGRPLQMARAAHRRTRTARHQGRQATRRRCATCSPGGAHHDRLRQPEHQTRLTELYRDFDADGMTPLWQTREGLMPFHPQPRAVPHLWRWADLLPLAARSADLVPVGRGGERRAISLGNPGLAGDPYTTPTLWAAIQYLAPRENAPEHRHTQSAFRFVLEGEGVWTVVDGDPVAMRRGDLLLTPGWAFHGHQNVSDAPMAWLDGLDIPLVADTDQGFFEFGPDKVRTTSTPDRSASERLWGQPGLTPVALAGPARPPRSSPTAGRTPTPPWRPSSSWKARATPACSSRATPPSGSPTRPPAGTR